ncbi:RNA-binding protein 25 isoform X2 [Bradysia coprophila]|uniref:RNA-binding protein 25 isoform X2 n=1 Tax=Bradysia coprophila TaxID=38358 RepID=UPI00187D9ABF|nr:RNA-binding protein 25 isoform X2 [Bradysia coprophila]
MSFRPFMAPQGAMLPPMISGSSMSTPPPRATYRAGPTINQRPQMYMRPPAEPVVPQYEGPIITVFVGNISERVPEVMIKKILQTAGTVVSWKRVSQFGFCEYDGPTAGLRAVRILHDLDVAGKRLVAKVDAKNKLLLDNYKEEETRKLGSASRSTLEAEKKDDDAAMASISQILLDHKEDIDNFETIQEEQQLAKSSKVLQGTGIEEDKRDLINREIGKFRKTAEKEKEKDRKKREERDRDKDSRATTPPKKEKEKKSRRRSRSRSREERDRERERREREKEREYREREREREKEEREREREREQRERERDREEKVVKVPRDIQKEKEIEDELRERKKAEKKARDKEAAYQERLRNWEIRERRQIKEYEKTKEKELNKEEEREKEAKRLKEFLEDYDDERDDPKYYKSRELQRRLAERVREADLDAKDRNKEQEELEDLKAKIFSGEFENPTQEFERLKREREELYKPKILIDVNLEQSLQREREIGRELEREKERKNVKDRERLQKERYVVAQASRELAAVNAEPIESDSSNDDHFNSAGASNNGSKYGSPTRHSNNDRGSHRDSESRDSHTNHFPPDDDSRASMHSIGSASPSNNDSGHPYTPPISQPIISLNLGAANAKKKKLEVKDIFNNDDDSEDLNGPKRRKLVPLDYEDASNQKSSQKSSSKRKDGKPDENSKKDDAAKSQEEKRRHIKSIIDKIPTGKNDLFSYKLDWNEIDNVLMEKKIRPWINKKIIEYIGEPEPTLVDFICSKVLAGSTAQGILDDVQMVLDEEAEVFVVKMWRLLIYEVEAKKVGLGK